MLEVAYIIVAIALVFISSFIKIGKKHHFIM